jgi:hypothetical protein
LGILGTPLSQAEVTRGVQQQQRQQYLELQYPEVLVPKLPAERVERQRAQKQPSQQHISRGTVSAVTYKYKEGDTTGELGAMPTVTGSLGQKPDTVGAAVNTTHNMSIPSMGVTDAVAKGNDGGVEGWTDLPDNGAKSGRVPATAGRRPATVLYTMEQALLVKEN